MSGCGKCDDYKRQGHNYCRMCGEHLTKSHVQKVRVAKVYHVNERYCGYCGSQKEYCDC